MTAIRTYLDHNATTMLRPEARAAMCAAWEVFGNPSSIHAEGRAARALVETARAQLADLTGVEADGVIFTSGATEALNLALDPQAYAGTPFDRLILIEAEHAAVRVGHRFGGGKTVVVPLTREGTVDLAALEQALRTESGAGGRPLVALQAANSETGVLQPIVEAAALTHAAGGALVCDAVQAPGRISCDPVQLPADILVLSAHKMGGPKGVGALCVRGGGPHLKNGLIRGGGQERGLRSGTENVAGIAGFGAAAATLLGAASPYQLWRDRLEDDLRRLAPDAVIFGAGTARLPNTSSFAVPGLEARLVTMSLDLEGIAVSAGSACASGKIAPSPALLAMGVPEGLARGAVRISLGWCSAERDMAAFARAFERIMARLGARRAA